MKKNILSILALLCLTATSAWADSETIGTYTWTYTVTEGKATVGGVSPMTGDIIIPASLGENPVTSIYQNTFLNCTGLTSVTIPATVTSIGTSAFEGCTGLTSVDIPASVTEIDDYAFKNCTGLTTVKIGKGMTYINQDAFLGCTSVSDVYCYAGFLTSLDSDGDDFKASKATKCHVFDKSAWNTSTANVTFENLTDAEKTVSVTANKDPDNTSNYWCTYYNPLTNVSISTGSVKIYKAEILFNGADSKASGVTLTEITEPDNVIEVGQAVMLKATSATVNMVLTTTASSGDYNDNDLTGGKTVDKDYKAYTLSSGSSNKLGFYKFTGASLDGSKAHLEIYSDYQPDRGFVGFGEDDATGIRPTPNPSQNEGEWYDLSGRRLSGQPTRKGVYVRNGQKFVMK